MKKNWRQSGKERGGILPKKPQQKTIPKTSKTKRSKNKEKETNTFTEKINRDDIRGDPCVNITQYEKIQQLQNTTIKKRRMF